MIEGYHRPARETPFLWRFAGGPMVVRDRFLAGIHDSNGISLVNRHWPDTLCWLCLPAFLVCNYICSDTSALVIRHNLTIFYLTVDFITTFNMLAKPFHYRPNFSDSSNVDVRHR